MKAWTVAGTLAMALALSACGQREEGAGGQGTDAAGTTGTTSGTGTSGATGSTGGMGGSNAGGTSAPMGGTAASDASSTQDRPRP